MNQKLKKDADLLQFLQTVKTCRGDVHFQTDDGDNLNLKSVLSQFIFAALAGKPWLLEMARISCDQEEDYLLLHPFLTSE